LPSGTVEIGKDFGPRSPLAEVSYVVLQCLLQHERKEAARHLTADRLVELVEDRARDEKVFRYSERLLHHRQLLVAKHGIERGKVRVAAKHEDAVEPGYLFAEGRLAWVRNSSD
jgi:hypothetical protein